MDKLVRLSRNSFYFWAKIKYLNQYQHFRKSVHNNNMTLYICAAIFIVLASGCIAFYQKLSKTKRAYQISLHQIKELEIKYEGIECRREEIKKLEMVIKELEIETQEKAQKIIQLQKNIYNLENEEFIKSSNFFEIELSHDFQGKKEYKESLTKIQRERRKMFNDRNTIVYNIPQNAPYKEKWIIELIGKLMIRSFNSDCDAAIAITKHNNFKKVEKLMRDSYKQIHEILNSHRDKFPYKCKIAKEYLEIRIKEYKLIYQFEKQNYDERQHQYNIKEKIKESKNFPEKLKKIEQDLEKAKLELKAATSEETKISLRKKVEAIKSQYKIAKNQEKEMEYYANMTRPGYVYITSNVGSFGTKKFFIGVTYKINKEEILRKLQGDCVPFPSDLHGMIFCEDAPKFAEMLYQKLDSKRWNKINVNKHFFATSIQEIEKAARQVQKEIGSKKSKIDFIKTAEAAEYNQSLAESRKK
ncbi:MAG: DUF4041 domain-containing protein [Scytonematopsis contorta HA4267-MV1]|nr:DUF4041 domain-containing protein [Scytonematopsis contorta HA4267-MV1]